MIRIASLGDLDEIMRIEARCFRKGRFRRDHVEWILRNERALTLVEGSGRHLGGAVMLLFESGTCRILSIAVLPPLRRRGLGTRLMRAAEAAAAQRGALRVRLEVGTENVAAMQLYQSLGYEMEGLLPRYYSWGEDAYSMSRPLARAGRPAALHPSAGEG